MRAAVAAAIDARIAAAWDGHPRRFVVASAPSFLDKLAQTLALLRAEVPPCCRGHFDAPAGGACGPPGAERPA